MAVLGEKVVEFDGRKFKLIKASYEGDEVSFSVDQTATAASVVEPASGGPTVTLGAASGGLKTVTLAQGGSSNGGSVTLALASGTTVGSSKISN